MFKASRHLRSVVTLGVAAALAVGGVAVAQGGPQGPGNSQENGGRPLGPPQGGPGGPGGPGMIPKGLTYAQFHVVKKDGSSGVIRLDQGKIAAIDSDAVTLEENDGSSVTIALDEETEVVTGPGVDDVGVDDLSVGQRVSVCGPEGEAAKAIMVAPKKPPVRG